MQRTRIKICGLTTVESVALASRLGADAIGLVFYPPSPRHLEPAQGRPIAAAAAAFVTRVALFLNPQADWVNRVIEVVRPDCLQFHGTEPAEFCAGFGLPYLKAVPMADTPDAEAYARRYPDAVGFLLDSHAAGEAGGSGRTLDWHDGMNLADRPTILAGGLDPDNVDAAIRAVRPYAVDVSSGVESAPGVKDPERMRAFVEAVCRADRQLADW